MACGGPSAPPCSAERQGPLRTTPTQLVHELLLSHAAGWPAITYPSSGCGLGSDKNSVTQPFLSLPPSFTPLPYRLRLGLRLGLRPLGGGDREREGLRLTERRFGGGEREGVMERLRLQGCK
eukprot:1136471-Pelagomonas_calceolata.AAC.1